MQVSKINTFLEKGNNKLIAKIIDAVLIAVLSVFTLIFTVRIISTNTADTYALHVVKNLIWLIVFGGADLLLIIFTKPLFGFTSAIENHRARKANRIREKAQQKAAQQEAKERIKKAHLEAKAAKAAAKNK